MRPPSPEVLEGVGVLVSSPWFYVAWVGMLGLLFGLVWRDGRRG